MLAACCAGTDTALRCCIHVNTHACPAPPPQSQPLLWLGQRALEPLQRLLADNCHLTRDPLPAITACFDGGVDARRFSVDGASLIAPHVAGIARRSGGGGGGGGGGGAALAA